MSLSRILKSNEYYSMSSFVVWVLYKVYNVKYEVRRGGLMDPRSLYWILPSYDFYSMSFDAVWAPYVAYNVKY